MIFYPQRVALAGILVWLGLFIIAPVELVFPVSSVAMSYVGLCYLCFFVGCRFIKTPLRTSSHVMERSVVFNGLLAEWCFKVVCVVGSLGLILRYCDKYVIRGASLDQSSIAAREVLADTSVGVVGMFGAALFPFCFIPLILFLVFEKARIEAFPKKYIYVAIVLFAGPTIDSILLNSRSAMLVSLAMLYFVLSAVRYNGRVLPRRLVYLGIVGASIVLLVSQIVFEIRLNEMGLAQLVSFFGSAYTYVLPPNEWATAVVYGGESITQEMVLSLLHIIQYYLHGIFEFSLLWESPNQGHSFGALQFFPYGKALSVIGVVEPPAFEDLFIRVGVFTSFFGPLWVDFYWFGPVFMLLFGYVSAVVGRQAKRHELRAYPLYTYICVVVFFFPVVNFFTSAQGAYILNAFILFWIYVTRVSRRKELAD